MVCPVSEKQPNFGHDMTGGGSCPAMRSEHQVHRELQGLPLGADSLLWKYFDNRMSLVAATGIKQLMMSGIDAGVDQHSKFFSEIVERTFRSMVQIGGTVFDAEKGAEIGRSIRDQHLHVKGIDAQGNRYHALHPKLWADTHITFMDGIYEVAERFDGHELTDDEREILWMEGITWYQQYGVSDRYLPADYTEYKQRSDEMVQEYLMTDTAKRALSYTVKGKIPRPNVVPEPLWRAMELPMKPAAEFLGAVVVSGLPERVRDEYKDAVSYTAIDKMAVAAVEIALKHIDWDDVPGWIRYPKPAFDAFRREGKYHGVSDELFVASHSLVSKSASTVRSATRRVRSLLPL